MPEMASGRIFLSIMPRNLDNNMEFPDMNSLNPGEMLSSLFSMLGLGDHQAEEAVRSFFTAWSEGNFENAYGQLASDSPLREGLSRKAWADRRKAWLSQSQATSLIFDVALPPDDEDDDESLDLFLSDEDEDEDAIPTPQARIIDIKTALSSSDTADIETTLVEAEVVDDEDDEDEDDDDEDEEDEDEGPVQVEVFWSLEIPQTPSESLPEIPTATLILKESGNHWFWSSYTVIQEDDQWLIQDVQDEGANTLALPTEEVQQLQTELIARIGELAEEVEEEMAATEDDDEDDEDEDFDDEDDDEDGEDTIADLEFAEVAGRLQATMWLTIRALHYGDILYAKLPDDLEVYENAYNQASQFQQFERSAAYAQIQGERHPEQRAAALRDYAVAMMNQSDLLVSDEELDDTDKQEIIEHYASLAERALEVSIATDDAIHSHILLANVLIKQQTRLDEADTHLQQLKSRDLNDMDRTYIALGEAHIARLRGESDKALSFYKAAAALTPDVPHIWFNIGHFQRELGDLETAQESLSRSIEEDPQEVEAYAELAAIFTQTNRLPAAQELLEDGLELNPDSVDLLAALSLVYTTNGDLKAAEEFLDEAEEIDSSHYLVEQAREQFDLARSRQRQKNKAPQKKQHQHQNKKKK
jgi:tetratricopeptide (TPR) repeat protein